MKSIINKKSNQEPKIKYPCLMIDDKCDRIVLFINGYAGIVVYGGDGDIPMGISSSSWDMSLYRPFEGSVTLSND